MHHYPTLSTDELVEKHENSPIRNGLKPAHITVSLFTLWLKKHLIPDPGRGGKAAPGRPRRASWSPNLALRQFLDHRLGRAVQAGQADVCL